MKLLKNSWDDITIADYKRINEIVNDDMATPIEKDMSVLALLCDVPEEEVWDMQVAEINELRLRMRWLDDFSLKKETKMKYLTVNGTKCRVMVNLQEMTVAQYVDFQNYWKDWEKNMEKLLSVFVIPEGHKYGDGYDVLEFQKTIEDNISFPVAQSVCFFFLHRLLTSTRVTVTSLQSMMKMREKMSPLSKKEESLKKNLQEIASLFGSR